MRKKEVKPCPFCGSKIKETNTIGGVTFFECANNKCGAIISFSGKKRLWSGATEAENPRENFNRRVAYGEWVYGENGYAHCSECGYEHDNPECVTPFCPGCGAKMEDEEDNQNG